MSVTNYLIPLVNEPQEFDIALAGVEYTLTCKWNDQPDSGWLLDIADSSGVPIVTNIPLITGLDLLEGLDYLGLQGSLFIYTDTDAFSVPTLDNLGGDSNLYFQTSVVGS